jgi:hypothetical protein
LLAVAIGLQVVRDRGWQPYQPPNPLLWVQSGPLLSRLALGYDNIIADVYWMRAVVYYGGKLQAEGQQRNFDLLYPLLDLVTSLDPHFKVAYRFGAIFLTEAYPSGPGRPDLAIGLLEKGIARDSAQWEYFQDIGFVYYWWLRDFKTAAEWFRRGAQQPGAPAWLELVAASTLTEGGDRQSSRFLWQQLRDGTDIAWVRRSATLRLLQLDAMDIIDELNSIADRFAARLGRPASGWPELVKAERLRGVPLDPAGVPLAYNPTTGRVSVDRRSPLWPLPTSMPHAQVPK